MIMVIEWVFKVREVVLKVGDNKWSGNGVVEVGRVEG